MAYFLFLCLCLLLLVAFVEARGRRVRAVDTFLRQLMLDVWAATRNDIRSDDYSMDISWRWEAFAKVTFADMMRLPWKPPASYYPDLLFAQGRIAPHFVDGDPDKLVLVWKDPRPQQPRREFDDVLQCGHAYHESCTAPIQPQAERPVQWQAYVDVMNQEFAVQSHADRWAQKYQKECPECQGTGVRRCYRVSATTFECIVDPPCEACEGTGKVPNESL